MPVTSMHPDLLGKKAYYSLIKDCLAGEAVVKAKGQAYLPMPMAEDQSPENVARYTAYLTRAVFYGVTKRTLGGLVGQVFARDPIVTVPDLLQVVIDDATGSGVNLTQFSKTATEQVIGFGRGGMLADFPPRDAPVTVAQITSGEVRPNLTFYEADKIINWNTIKRDGNVLLSLVVLQERYVKKDDGFEKTFGTQYRVLRLTGDVYSVTVYKDTNYAAPAEVYTPTDANGDPLSEIPFTFIGAKNNDTNVDDPPLYDLASLNIAHYRNSADYEESCFVVGQPTLVLAGLTQQWVTDVLKGKVQLGSRAAVPLPINATAQMLQAQPNSLPFEAMKHKEKQMVALGAKLIEDISVQRTATETAIDFSSETSILSASADNVSDAITMGLIWCARFIGAPIEEIDFTLNTEFDLVKLSPQDRTALVAEWQAGAISFGELRENLRRGGIATVDDTEAQAAIEKEQADRDARAIEKQKQMSEATGNPGNANNPTGKQTNSSKTAAAQKGK